MPFKQEMRIFCIICLLNAFLNYQIIWEKYCLYLTGGIFKLFFVSLSFLKPGLAGFFGLSGLFDGKWRSQGFDAHLHDLGNLWTDLWRIRRRKTGGVLVKNKKDSQILITIITVLVWFWDSILFYFVYSMAKPLQLFNL